MIILNDNTRSLEIVLGATVADVQLQWTCSWEAATTSFGNGNGIDDDTGGASEGSTNDTTAVEMIPAPDSNTVTTHYARRIKFISVYNADSTIATVTIRINRSSTYYILIKIAIDTGSTLTYEDGAGWVIVNSDGSSPGNGNVTTVGTAVDNQIAVFAGAQTIEGDPNFLWDGTSMHVGGTTGDDTLNVHGDVSIVYSAAETDDQALEININANGYGDVKALSVAYKTGVVTAGEDGGVILINIDDSGTTGGEIFALEVLTTDFGSIAVYALKAGVDVHPVSHDSGTFGNMDSALNKAVNVLAALSSGGAGNISMFVADNDTVTIGDAAMFDEMEILVDTPSSGAGIAPVFEYSTGVGTWATFTATDGTNGFRNTGSILWDSADLVGWVVGTGAEYLVRITRTRNTLTTTPIVDTVQISLATIYYWDKTGAVKIKNITSTDLTASEIVITDANKKLVSAAVATYPSLAELARIKGLTSAVQTQLDAKIFTLTYIGAALSPSDSTTYYLGLGRITPSTTAGNHDDIISTVFAFTIIGAVICAANNTISGTTEDNTLQLRNVTDATSTSIGAFDTDGSTTVSRSTTITGLSIAVAASKSICLQWDAPAYVTNPTNCVVTVTLICTRP